MNRIAITIGTLAILALPLWADKPTFQPPASAMPPDLKQVGVDQKLNAQVPLELTFHDEAGNIVRLGQYFNGKPVVLSLVYYQCPMLCNQELNGLARAMRSISLEAGVDFQVVTVSIDPRETPELALAKKEAYLEKYARKHASEGWHFLTGKQENIAALASAVGFRYHYNPVIKQFAHAAAIMVATPEGKLSRYFYGIEYKPEDFRLSLVEASNRKIGSPVDALILYCYHYDPNTGKYGLVIQNVIRVLASATALTLFGFVFVMLRRERRGGPADPMRSA